MGAHFISSIRQLARATGPRSERATAIAEKIREENGYRWVGIYDIDHARSEISALGWDGLSAPAVPKFPITEGLIGAAVASREVVNVADVRKDRRYLATIGDTRSEIIVPVVDIHGYVVGALDVESNREAAFGIEDVRFLQQCATAAAALWVRYTQPEKVRSVLSVRIAESTQDIEAVRLLFREYANWLAFSLEFQNFDEEVKSLPGDYAPPSGRLLLGYDGVELAGCAGLHAWHAPSTEHVCEVKRLFVRESHHGRGIGKALLSTAIEEARKIGYKKMRLDSVAGKMDAAIGLYKRFGFREIAPYRHNPQPGAMFMELKL